jgi:hypothetical protein
VKEREGIVGFHFRKRKLLLGKIQATRTVDFCVKWFQVIKEILLGVFFTFKTPKKNLSSERFMVLR